MATKKKLKLNVDLNGHKAGEVISIKVDKDGVPLNQFWRNRVADAPIDRCVAWVNNAAKSVKKKEIEE